MIFRNVVEYYKNFLEINVAMISVTPMDAHGYFNLSTSTGIAKGILDKADIVIVEVNENLPRVYGGIGDSIHISEVDMVVELQARPAVPGAPRRTHRSRNKDRGTHNAVHPRQCHSPARHRRSSRHHRQDDRRLRSERPRDAHGAMFRCVLLYTQGRQAEKQIPALSPGKGVFGIAFGTDTLYEWVHENPGVISYPLEYVNSPEIIAKIDNMISINSCISTDLYGQVCAESSGTRQISGTGGQLDFLTGAAMSKGGKAFICMPSVFRGKGRHARIQHQTHLSGGYRHFTSKSALLPRD